MTRLNSVIRGDDVEPALGRRVTFRVEIVTDLRAAPPVRLPQSSAGPRLANGLVEPDRHRVGQIQASRLGPDRNPDEPIRLTVEPA